MAQKKSHEVDAWLARPDSGTRIVLVYGPDRGLASERARRFAAATGLPLDDPFSVVKMDASLLDQQPGRLSDELRTVPMFADRRLVWVTDAGSGRGVAEAVADLVAHPAPDALLLIEAGDLKKTAPLRTVIEKASDGMALPCYADEGRAIDGLIDETLSRAGLSITMDARQMLRIGLGGDRLATRSELEKLVLYCAGASRIDVADVAAATGDVSGLSVDEAVDAVIAGRPDAFDLAFSRLTSSGQQPFLVLAAATRQFQALLLMRATMDATRRDAATVVAGARPPVFFTRRNLVKSALESRNCTALERALNRLARAIADTRKRPDLALSTTHLALLAICLEGRR